MYSPKGKSTMAVDYNGKNGSLVTLAMNGRGENKELIQCPTLSCDGMGHISGNYATHRRQATNIC